MEGITILQKTRNYLPIDTTSNPRRLEYLHLYHCTVTLKHVLLHDIQERLDKSKSEDSQFLSPISSSLPPLYSLFYFPFIQFSLIIYRLIIRYDTTFQHNDYSFPKQNSDILNTIIIFTASWNSVSLICISPPSEMRQLTIMRSLRHFCELYIVWLGVIEATTTLQAHA
jgi:hypothetical protein